MSARKTPGLGHNPLLARTETKESKDKDAAAVADTPMPPGTQAGEHVDTTTRTRVPDRSLKFTFYFTEEQLDRLDQVWETLRRTRRRPRRRVSKSQFVRVALDRLLDEFDRDPDQVTRTLLTQLDMTPRRTESD